MKRGSLVIVGTGIKAIAQMTNEAVAAIKRADKVLYGACEPLTEQWIRANAKTSECLDRHYMDGELRMKAYGAMIDEILANVRSGLNICVSIEGHPGIFVYMSHESIRLARKEGYSARMLPGISTQGALFADLLVDPGQSGYQSFDATDFLLRRYKPDVTSMLVLWQVGCIGDLRYHRRAQAKENVIILASVLQESYGREHEVTAYRAPLFTITKATITSAPLWQLPQLELELATLYVPPLSAPRFDAHLASELGFS